MNHKYEMISLGELLKTQRKQRGVSLEQVAQTTKIPVKLLKALEQGDYEQFSSEIYLKGFLKNYAKYLKIDTGKALAIYRRERKDRKEENFNSPKKPLDEPKPFITPGRLVFALTAIIIVSVLVFVVVQVNKIIKPPYLEITEPIQGQAPGQYLHEVSTENISIAGKLEVGSKLFINGSEVTTNNLQEFRVDNFQLKPGSNEINIVAESYYFSKTNEIKLTVVSNTQIGNQDIQEEEQETEEVVEEDAVENMNIQLKIGQEDTWVVVDVDGSQVLAQTAAGESEFEFEALESFSIYSPKPQMIGLTINDTEYALESQTQASFMIENGEIKQQ